MDIFSSSFGPWRHSYWVSPFFSGLLAFLLVNNFRDNFLTAEFYTDSLSENDVYDRIYDQVLLDPDFADTTNELLGDIDVTQGEIARVAREIIPPDYLQEQVEEAVDGAIAYLDKETDTPEVFIDLTLPLGRVKPALFRYIDQRIDEYPDKRVSTIEELQDDLENLYRRLEQGDIRAEAGEDPIRIPFVEDPESLVLSYVDESIGNLQEVQVETPEEFKQELEHVYRELTNGRIPTRIPSIEGIPLSIRNSIYDQVVRVVLNDPSIPDEVKRGLEREDEAIKAQLREGSVTGALEVAAQPLTGPAIELFVDDAYDHAFQALKDEGFPERALEGLDQQRDAVKEHLGAGRIKESLKLGARSLAGPLIDDATAELRKELDEEDRLDLVAKAAEQNNQTKEEFLEDLDTARDVINLSELGLWLTILVMVVGAVLMAVVHIPRLSSALRWPGITLFLSGLVFLAIGLVWKSQLSNVFDDLVERGTSESSPIPNTMVDIIADVLTSMSADIANGLVGPSITVMVIGLALIIASVVIRMLRIPFLSR